MPNVLIPNLPRQTTEAEKDYILRYLQQLHFVRGYDTIYLVRNIVDEKNTPLDYVKVFPEQFEEEVYSSIEAMKEKIDRMLWCLKKTDHMEAGLTPFLSLYSLWLRAKLANAFVLFSGLSLVSPVIHLCQVLTNERRDFIGNLAEDIELWFFSHFADVRVHWPFFLSFSNENRKALEKQIDFEDFHQLLNQLFIYPRSTAEWNDRAKTIARVRDYAKLILISSKKQFRSEIVVTTTPIVPRNSTLRSFEQLTWNYSTFAKQIKMITRKENRFTPYFGVDALYPRELIVKMIPFEGNVWNVPMLLRIAPESSGYATIELAHKAFLRRLSHCRSKS